jgi:hypothetical protein
LVSYKVTEELVVLLLADADLKRMLKRCLYNFKMFGRQKHMLLRNQFNNYFFKSWFLLQVAKVGKTDIYAWAVNGMVDQSFVTWVKQLTVVNDASGHNVRLVQDFYDSYKSEPQRQNNFQVVKSNRKKLKTDFNRSDLEALTKE